MYVEVITSEISKWSVSKYCAVRALVRVRNKATCVYDPEQPVVSQVHEVFYRYYRRLRKHTFYDVAVSPSPLSIHISGIVVDYPTCSR